MVRSIRISPELVEELQIATRKYSEDDVGAIRLALSRAMHEYDEYDDCAH